MSRRLLPPLALAALLAAGCFGGKTPVTTVWSLPAPAATAPGVNPDGAALGVERFQSNAELRTTSLTYREGDGRQLKRYPYQEWSDYPDRMLHERLVTQLLSTRSFRSVTGVPPRRDLDAILSARLVEFDEWDDASGVRVKVGLRWTLEGADGALLGGELTRSEQEAAKSVDAVVAAYERASAEVLQAVAARAAELLAKD